MEQVLPVIIICSVGMAACLAYIVFVSVRVLHKKGKIRKRNIFEIDEDSLTIKLGKKK